MTNGFALNHAKNLQIYFCVKRQAKKRLSERCRKHSSSMNLDTYAIMCGITKHISAETKRPASVLKKLTCSRQNKVTI